MHQGPEKVPQPFDEIVLACNDRPTMEIEGSHELTRLEPTEFVVMLHLKKARGNYVPYDYINRIMSAENGGKERMANDNAAIVSQLRTKLETISDGRFGIGTWTDMGWYLTDTEHPELEYHNAARWRESGALKSEAMKGNVHRKGK